MLQAVSAIGNHAVFASEQVNKLSHGYAQPSRGCRNPCWYSSEGQAAAIHHFVRAAFGAGTYSIDTRALAGNNISVTRAHECCDH